MAEWSPQDAMKAYWSTLHLLKIHYYQDQIMGNARQVIEPKSMEFVSALAAGNQAKLMIQITSKGPTPLTKALTVAAKEIGGRLICIIPSHKVINSSYANWLANSDLKQVITIVIGDPCEVVKKYKKIEFVVIDCKVENEVKILRSIDVNTRGSIVVLGNIVTCRESVLSFGEVLKERKGVKCVTTRPIGEGMELMRIGSFGKCERREGTIDFM